jgi:hypothetical protein
MGFLKMDKNKMSIFDFGILIIEKNVENVSVTIMV